MSFQRQQRLEISLRNLEIKVKIQVYLTFEYPFKCFTLRHYIW